MMKQVFRENLLGSKAEDGVERLKVLWCLVSQGATIESALANLKEATELYLEEFPLPDVGRPLLTTFEAKCA